MDKVSVIIPTLNAEKELPCLFETLKKQKHNIDEILVVDSESEDKTIDICKKEPLVRLIQIARKNFDHGGTRDFAFRQSIGDIVVFLTQDALPVNEDFLSNLIEPLRNKNVVISSGRQLPKKNATDIEKLIRTYNYPEKSYIKSSKDLPIMGIKTFFCSDVCAAYKKNVYVELGGFDYPIKTNEDMFFAAKAINSGYKISYTANALVYHSHNFSFIEQYRRNYIQGYEIEKHRELLNNVELDSEGLKLVKFVSGALLKKFKFISFIYFVIDCVFRVIGSKFGRKKAIAEKMKA